MNKVITLSILSLFILSSCGSKIDSAKESLIGSWKVKEIYRYNNSTGLSVRDSSGIGNFDFTETQCDYNYTFESIAEMNSFEYEFQATKENSGFFKVDRFDVLGEENFRVRFGDETSDAHEDATEAMLESSVANDSVAFEMIIFLEKT